MIAVYTLASEILPKLPKPTIVKVVWVCTGAVMVVKQYADNLMSAMLYINRVPVKVPDGAIEPLISTGRTMSIKEHVKVTIDGSVWEIVRCLSGLHQGKCYGAADLSDRPLPAFIKGRADWISDIIAG